MKTSVFAGAALVAAAVFCAVPSIAFDSSAGSVNVRVVSADNGLPVERVPVQLSASGSIIDGMTDRNGIVRFAGVQSGIASVETSERAIGACAQTVSVRNGAATEITIRVRAPEASAIDAWVASSPNCSL
jgi:hypothetical protein